MELFYNPDQMPEEEIKATFVAHQGLIDELTSLIKRQPDGAGVQHVVIIAPRGMGKTTVLLMLRYAIRESGLSKRWQSVKFREESYGVNDLADFWFEALNLLATETKDDDLGSQAERLKSEYPDSDALQEAGFALLKDWRRKHKKRLAVLVDNFDLILEQINDERDNARLRDVLMNDGTIMLIGCAGTFFREARAYDQPLYNFFKIYNLDNLKFEQMQELLRRRAHLDEKEGFEAILKANENRLRVLEYFTAGNPRLVLMLYRVVTHSDISEVRRGLEKLLDEVTPYYKAKVESLSPQQRKILDHIARVSSRTREGLTPTEIAKATRLTANHVSAQLQRLSECGYVRAANLRGRSSYYTLSEPLYSIWYQMRFGRDARQRMQWLVDFLKVWYDAEEMKVESVRLEARFRTFFGAGRMREARDALEHQRYLAQAMDDTIARASAEEGIICGYLDLKDTGTLSKEVLTAIELEHLSNETLDRLYRAGCINESDLGHAKASTPSSTEGRRKAEALAANKLGTQALSAKRLEEALECFARALEIDPRLHRAWINRGFALAKLDRSEEAITSYDRGLELESGNGRAWYLRGLALDGLGRPEEAIASYDRALEVKGNHTVWYKRGTALFDLDRYQEALGSFDRALEIESKNHHAWFSRGITLRKLGRYVDALASFANALEAEPDCHASHFNRGVTLHELNRDEEALESFDRVLALSPDNDEAWNRRGITLGILGRQQEALASFTQGLEIKRDSTALWHNKGHALLDLNKPDQALESFSRALEIEPGHFELELDRGVAFYDMSRYEDALTSFDRALAIAPVWETAWFNRGNALSSLSRYEDAIASYDRALEIKPDFLEAWHFRGVVLNQIGNYEDAISSLDRALQIRPDFDAVLRDRTLSYLGEATRQLDGNKFDLAKHNWSLALKSASRLKESEWYEIASEHLLSVAQSGRLEFTRQLIDDSALEEPLFPLARALDYLLTSDEALIEKLSPEIRGIVEEIVGKLRDAANKSKVSKTRTPANGKRTKKKSKAPKTKPGSRKRVGRKLR